MKKTILGLFAAAMLVGGTATLAMAVSRATGHATWSAIRASEMLSDRIAPAIPMHSPPSATTDASCFT